MWNNNSRPPPFPTASRGYQPGYAPSYGPPSGPPPQGTQASLDMDLLLDPLLQVIMAGEYTIDGTKELQSQEISSYGPPPGPPPSGYGPPQGPPPVQRNNYPGQQYHQSHNGGGGGGYPGQAYANQNYANQYHPGGPPPRPPAQAQHYGPHYQGPQHEDRQPYFQYSQCTGKKKALCIGINYVGRNGELNGCINDARNISRFLCTHFGYKQEDIVMLTDDATNPRQIPTGQNIIQAMQWLVNGASPNDSLFFHYSGHGGQTKDLDGDEDDGYDEVIYPLDHEENGHIIIHDILVKPLPAGCRLTAIFDSCHSGSALDLPYIYSTEGKVKEPNLAAEAGQGLLSAATSYARGDMKGVFSSAMGLIKTASGQGQKAQKKARETKTSPADCISFSGCKDSQTSADTVEAGNATGAMSFAFISTLSANPQQSYMELLNNVRDILRSKYSQKPQLSASHPIDTNLMFIC
ncbi:Ca(2+)-dependent cysteine protease [Marasmius crinis-equi]|uniref:Ca(2+)-dependent cysteine protease n=1 Tax=Marasmius crinis-equi TaxID=585013 RepID=A0ABR3F8C3_9AGAR